MTSKVAFVLAFLLASMSNAHASPRIERRHVRLECPSDPALEETLRELLGRIGLVLERGDGPSDDELARVRVEHDADGVTVHVDDARGSSAPFVRTLKKQGTDAVFREALAHVILSAVDPLVEAEPPPAPALEAKSVPAPPAPDVPRKEQRAPNTWAFEVGTQFGGGTFGSGSVVVPTVAATAAVRARQGWRWGGVLLLRYGIPFESGDEAVGTRVSTYAARVVPVVELASFRHLALDAGLGFGGDILVVAPQSAVLPSSRLSPSSTRVDPIVTASFTTRFGLSEGVDLSLSCALDADFADRHWVFEAGTVREDVFAPSRLRPFIALGLDVTLAGTGRTRDQAR